MGVADARSDDANTKEEFKADVKRWLQELDANKQTRAEKTEELKSQYNEMLRDSIEEVRVITNTDILTDEQIEAAVLYIVDEIIKDEKIKLFKSESNSVSRLNVDFLNYFGIQTAYATCNTPTIPTFKQLTLDINGGSYGEYTFNGDNDLYEIETTPLSSHCETLYELKFYDEDHPNLDEFYDEVRLFWLHRIYDVEPIIIHNNNLIEFDNTWSSTNDYDCLSLIFACHETTIKAYTPGQVVYVSNTWNHMMDTSDTNPGYSKVTVP